MATVSTIKVSQLIPEPAKQSPKKLKKASRVAPISAEQNVRKQLLKLFNGGKAAPENAASEEKLQALRARGVSIVSTYAPASAQPQAAPRKTNTVVAQPQPAPKVVTDKSHLLPKVAEEETELTCCQKVMKVVCCCFSS